MKDSKNYEFSFNYKNAGTPWNHHGTGCSAGSFHSCDAIERNVARVPNFLLRFCQILLVKTSKTHQTHTHTTGFSNNNNNNNNNNNKRRQRTWEKMEKILTHIRTNFKNSVFLLVKFAVRSSWSFDKWRSKSDKLPNLLWGEMRYPRLVKVPCQSRKVKKTTKNGRCLQFTCVLSRMETIKCLSPHKS